MALRQVCSFWGLSWVILPRLIRVDPSVAGLPWVVNVAIGVVVIFAPFLVFDLRLFCFECFKGVVAGFGGVLG